MDTIKIDFHLSHYQSACHKLVSGISDPKEFARLETIRDAALCAIALEANIITQIGTGKLDRSDWEKAIAWIKQYQRADQEIELTQDFFQLPPLQVCRIICH